MDEIYIYHVALPDGCNEAVLPCMDGYTIYINEKLDETQQLAALRHAMKHIKRNDWEKYDVQQIEHDAHE